MTRKQKRIMVAVAIRVVVALIGFTGFFAVFFSVGSLEQDLIGIPQFIIQSLIGLAVMYGAIDLSNKIF